MTIFGIDLTDPYAKKSRSIDIAVLNGTQMTFLTHHHAGDWDIQSLNDLLKSIGWKKDDVMVIDGPQGLAEPQNRLRDCEVKSQAPGRTSWCIHAMEGKPFGNYIRGSLSLFKVMLKHTDLKVHGLCSAANVSNVFESFPGIAWKRLNGNTFLPAKKSKEGIATREMMLRALGIEFTDAMTHDMLDSAICAVLGLWGPDSKHCEMVGKSVFLQGDILREGQMLLPRVRQGLISLPPNCHKPSVNPVVKTGKDGLNKQVNCDARFNFIYFASGDTEDWDVTLRVILEEGICRTVYRDTKPGTPKATVNNLGALRPRDTILVCHDGYPRLLTRANAAENPILSQYPCIVRLDNLEGTKYRMDPVLGYHTGILVDEIARFSGTELPMPSVTGDRRSGLVPYSRIDNRVSIDESLKRM